MKKADNTFIIINGDNNNVNFGENHSPLSVAAKTLFFGLGLGLGITAIVLAVSHCCPELLPELLINFVRLAISLAKNS